MADTRPLYDLFDEKPRRPAIRVTPASPGLPDSYPVSIIYGPERETSGRSLFAKFLGGSRTNPAHARMRPDEPGLGGDISRVPVERRRPGNRAENGKRPRHHRSRFCCATIKTLRCPGGVVRNRPDIQTPKSYTDLKVFRSYVVRRPYGLIIRVYGFAVTRCRGPPKTPLQDLHVIDGTNVLNEKCR